MTVLLFILAACSNRYSTDIADVMGTWSFEHNPRQTLTINEDGTTYVMNRIMLQSEGTWEYLGDGEIRMVTHFDDGHIWESTGSFRVQDDRLTFRVDINGHIYDEHYYRVLAE